MALQKVNILVVEDEAIVALDLSAGLQKDGYNVIGTADNAAEAVELFSQFDVDIVLMDINIHGDKDGVETATELLKLKQVPIIYLTAFTDTATINRVKQTHPAAFLTKPYSINNVRIAIELALNNFASTQVGPVTPVVALHPGSKQVQGSSDKEQILQLNDSLFIKHNFHFVKLKMEDLLYLEADNNYVNIVTGDRRLNVRLSLTQVLEKINFKQLVRIHRSYAVNMNAIQMFNESMVQINKTELPVGRNYRDEFLKLFRFS